MQQILVEVEDEAKAKMLLEFLRSVSFVSVIRTNDRMGSESGATTSEGTPDFFSLAGLWAGREVSLASIRRKAWPKQQK